MQSIVYVCSTAADRVLREKITDWANRGTLGPSWVGQASADGLGRGHLGTALSGCAAMILIVGQDTHEDEAVVNAVNHITTSRKRLIVVAAPGASPTLPRNIVGHPLTPLAPDALKAALSR